MADVPTALTIAGSDSGGGAGIEADLKTFTVFGVYGTAAVTSVTAQNTLGVSAIHDVPGEVVGKQIDAVVPDIGADAVKTGMLSTTEIIDIVSNKIERYNLQPVIDPVMVTKSGDPLLEPTALETFKEKMIPLAHIITPNIIEAEMISGTDIHNISDAKEAAELIHEKGASNVIIKSLEKENKVVDLFYDGVAFQKMTSKKYKTNKHGTGCTYSAAITANLAKGKSIIDAVHLAKAFIDDAIKEGLALGKGERPVNHMVWL